MIKEVRDEELRVRLHELDNNDNINVTSWEANFIESILYTNKDRKLTDKQKTTIKDLLSKYRD